MLERFISAINGLNQPYIAIAVVIIGCIFDVVCQRYNISNDAATGIIGAGIGLLTGQALSRPHDPSTQVTTRTTEQRIESPSPVIPAQPKETQ